MAPIDGTDKLRGRRLLILGNSPAIGEVDFGELPADVVTIGVNRIMRAMRPTYLLVVDNSVERVYIPGEGSLEGGLISMACCTHRLRADGQPRADVLLFERQRPGPPSKWNWPTDLGGQVVPAANTACYAFQLGYLWGAAEIALLGLDYDGSPLHGVGARTHFYGTNPAVPVPPPFPEDEQAFWRIALGVSGELGIPCRNLSPRDDAPFHSCGWPRETWSSYCARTGPLDSPG